MKLARQLKEDRAMREAALTLFKSDLELIRQDQKNRGLGARLADRLGEGAADMAEDAADYVSNNRGTIAVAAMAAALWFARRPILRLFAGEEEETSEPEAPLPGSEEE
jgi:glutathione S-transferase